MAIIAKLNINKTMKPDIDKLKHYILDTLLNHSETTITPDQDLLLSGLLDSLSVMRLVAWLESSHAIKIPPEDILVEHFGSLNQIMDYLKSHVA